MKTIRQAAVLCGGLGTRLHPITLEKPKPLVEVGGKPMLELVLSKLAHSGITEAVLLTGYRHPQVEDYFGDGTDFGISLKYSVEDKPMGSAGALLLAKRHLQEDFLVCNCDTISNFDFTRLFLRHEEAGSLGTLLVAPVENVERFGIAELEHDFRVSRFLEKPKPDETPSRYANLQIFAFDKAALSYAKKDAFSIEREVFPLMCRDRKLYAQPLGPQDEWVDVGTLAELQKVNAEIEDGRHAWLFD